MNIVIETKNFEITNSLKVLVHEKLSAFAADHAEYGIFVEIGKESKHHKKGDIFVAQAVMTLPKKKLVAKAHGESLAKAIAAMRNELKREMQTYKAKTVDLPRRKYRKEKQEI